MGRRFDRAGSGGPARRLYRGALALILPSVLARAVGPLPEILGQSGEAGLLFTTPDELRDAMGRIAADPDLRRRMGEQGRQPSSSAGPKRRPSRATLR